MQGALLPLMEKEGQAFSQVPPSLCGVGFVLRFPLGWAGECDSGGALSYPQRKQESRAGPRGQWEKGGRVKDEGRGGGENALASFSEQRRNKHFFLAS